MRVSKSLQADVDHYLETKYPCLVREIDAGGEKPQRISQIFQQNVYPVLAVVKLIDLFEDKTKFIPTLAPIKKIIRDDQGLDPKRIEATAAQIKALATGLPKGHPSEEFMQALVCYLSGQEDLSCVAIPINKYYLARAKKDDSAAQALLAMCSIHGIGVDQNLEIGKEYALKDTCAKLARDDHLFPCSIPFNAAEMIGYLECKEAVKDTPEMKDTPERLEACLRLARNRYTTPRDIEYAVDFYFGDENFKCAAKIYDEFLRNSVTLKNYAQSLECKENAAATHRKAGNFSRAAEIGESIMADQSATIQHKRNALRDHFKAGNWPRAVQISNEILKLKDSNDDDKRNVGITHYNTDDFVGAVAIYEELDRAKVAKFDDLRILAASYYESGNFSHAAELAEKLMHDPANSIPFVILRIAARAHYYMYNFSTAAPFFEELLKDKKLRPMDPLLAGDCQYQLGNYARAAEIFEGYLAKDDSCAYSVTHYLKARAKVQLAITYAYLNKTEEATKLLRSLSAEEIKSSLARLDFEKTPINRRSKEILFELLESFSLDKF